MFFIVLAGICLAQTGGFIKGKITDNRNEPAHNVSVIIKELDIATHTDSLGNYFFKQVPEGEYTLWFSHFSYIDTKRDLVKVVADRVTNVNMSLLPFQEERYINSRKKSLAPGNNNSTSTLEGFGKLSGHVSDKFGNPIMLADIRIMETNQIVQTDDFGKYLMTDVNPGIYTVSFSKFGYEERRFVGVQVKPNETTQKKVKLSFQQ
jgi:hypothetical protein